MTTTEVVKGRWYPQCPPALPGETDEQYTNRLTGADRTDRRPYDHSRNRRCSIGYHEECSDPNGYICECPCHVERVTAEARVDEWNENTPIGTVVSFVAGVDEPAVETTSVAFIDGVWPVVKLDTFGEPVKLSWLVAP